MITTEPQVVALTPSEVTQLAQYEQVIAAGLTTFVAVGNALLAIRDARLYRETHATFETYCRGRWSLTRSRAYELMEAAEVVGNLQTDVVNLLHRESHVAPLAKLSPEDQRTAWEEAVATAPNGHVTAAHVQAVVTRMVTVPVEKLGATFCHYCGERHAQWHSQGGGVFTCGLCGKMSMPHFAVDESDQLPETPSNGEMPAANVKNLGYVGRQPGTPERDSSAWYTPAEYIALAHTTMGGIDLDPFSSVIANTMIGAARILTATESAFEHSWLPSPSQPLRVWMNPPYSVSILPKAVVTFLDYWYKGHIDQALVLVNNCTETAWFKALREACAAVCFPTARIAFVSPDGKPISGGTRGQAVFYYGTPLQAAHFGQTFQVVGWVIDREKGWASYG